MKKVVSILICVFILAMAALPVFATETNEDSAVANENVVEVGEAAVENAEEALDIGEETENTEAAEVEAVEAAVKAGEVAENAESTSQESREESSGTAKIYTSAALIGAAAVAGALAMGWAITKASDGISRQPEAAGNIRTNTMLGLVFIETAIIYALIVAILIIFVL